MRNFGGERLLGDVKLLKESQTVLSRGRVNLAVCGGREWTGPLTRPGHRNVYTATTAKRGPRESKGPVFLNPGYGIPVLWILQLSVLR